MKSCIRNLWKESVRSSGAEHLSNIIRQSTLVSLRMPLTAHCLRMVEDSRVFCLTSNEIRGLRFLIRKSGGCGSYSINLVLVNNSLEVVMSQFSSFALLEISLSSRRADGLVWRRSRPCTTKTLRSSQTYGMLAFYPGRAILVVVSMNQDISELRRG